MTEWEEYRDSLDPAFAENVERMSISIDILKLGEKIDPRDFNPLPDDWQPAPPLEGYDRYWFFDPAAALSGQDVGLIEALYGVVNEVWMQSDDGINAFESGMGKVLSHWDGDASNECATYVGNIVGFVNNERDCLVTLARGLVAYAAIIQEARRSLNELMVACENGWTAVTQRREASGTNAAITVLTALTGAAVTVATGGAALPAFAGVVATTAGAAARHTVDLAGGNHADVADAYLNASAKLIGEAAVAIGDSALPELNRAQEAAPSPPFPPGDLRNPEEFHPRTAQAHGVTGPGPTSAAASTIERRLGPRR